MSSRKVWQRTGEDIMQRRGQKTTFQERIVISELPEGGHTDPEMVAYLGCSVWTVRKWRRIFERKGRDGLTTQMGRPVTGVLSTMPPELQTKLRTLREAHTGWGPESLLATLPADPAWSASRLPSRSRVAAYLKQEELTCKYQRQGELPQPPPKATQAPHEEWQMDAQGVMNVDGVGKVSVINVVDVASRLKVESCPRAFTSKPAAADYYVTLRRAFLTYGLPKRLSLDHDTVFFDNTSPSPFPTRLHLWLLGLGIDLVFIYLAQGRWFRYNNKGSVRLGTYDYYLDYHYDKQAMEITFDASQVAFYHGPVQAITAEVLRGYFSTHLHLRPATRARKKAAVARFLTWAHQHEVLDTNPMLKIERVKLDPPQPRGMERDQIERILKGIPVKCQRDQLFFRLLLDTGLRVSEGLSLYVENIDLSLDNEHLTVMGKGGKRRTLLLDDPRLVQQLRTYLKRMGYQQGPLFRAEKNARGGSLRYPSMQEHWDTYYTQAGVVCTLHQLRHTHATELINGGVSLPTIRKRLGHKNLQTTLRYAEQSDQAADAELRVWRRRHG